MLETELTCGECFMEHTFHMFYSPPPIWVCSECGSVFKFQRFDTDESLIYLKIGTATKNNDQPIRSSSL